MRILVVDDNADGANTLARLLRLYGHDTHVALDGPQALQQANTWLPDVVLLDLGLPRMDGYEVARQLRERLAPRPLRLAAVSGHGLESDRVRSLAEGFHCHFVKPVDPRELQEWLQVP